MAQLRPDLFQFLHPDGVALVGQIDRTATRETLEAAYTPRYGKRWFLVNPNGGAVDGVEVYPTLADLPEPVATVVISTPPRTVNAIVEEAARIGARFAVVHTAGFAEVGGEGIRLEQELGETARRTGIRVFGPNTNTNAFETIEPEVPDLRGGRIGLVLQSGHNGRPVVQGAHFGVGFSRQIPCGNEVDLEIADFVEYFAYDDETQVIGGYVEGFKDVAKLRRALEAANSQHKPVVLLKMGATREGSRMASSHTGHLNGSDDAVNGLFRQYGVTRVRDLDELLDTLTLFAKLPAGTGPRAALYSVSGGSGTVMAELCEQAGIPVPQLTQETQDALHEIIPAYLTVANPVDNGARFLSGNSADVRMQAVHLIADDPNVDYVIIGITGALPGISNLMTRDLLTLRDTCAKPLIVTWNSPKTFGDGWDDLVASGLPFFRSFRNCFGALRAFHEYTAGASTRRPRTPVRAERTPVAEAALATGDGGALAADAARALLTVFGIPLAREAVVASAAAAARTASSYGYPVVMKIASADFPHKSDAGLVRLGVATPTAARNTFEELMARARMADPNARLDGVLVQETITDGTECLVGVSHDPVLGPTVLVGLGGIFAEVLRDVAVRPIPFDREDADDMVRSLQGFSVLDGARGRPKADVSALVDVLLAVQELAVACGPRLAELDLNPVLVRAAGQGAVAVDSLVVVG